MKTLLILITALLLTGCYNRGEKVEDTGAWILRVRDCEYVRVFDRAIVHAGDCSNPKHKEQLK